MVEILSSVGVVNVGGAELGLTVSLIWSEVEHFFRVRCSNVLHRLGEILSFVGVVTVGGAVLALTVSLIWEMGKLVVSPRHSQSVAAMG